MYFDAFPYIYYDSKGDGDFKVVTNLLRRVAVRTKVKSNTALFDTYEIKEGESPESIAYHLYGDSELHWLILLFNDIVDRYHEWPLRRMQLLSYVADKYSDPNGTHHYEIAQSSGDTTTKIWIENDVDSDAYTDATPVTNYEYELELNVEKSKIRLLKTEYVRQVVSEFKSLIGASNF